MHLVEDCAGKKVLSEATHSARLLQVRRPAMG